jgi:hypothetical protein
MASVPMWDQRRGQVAEAGALLQKSRSDRDSQELTLLQALEARLSPL